MAGLFFQDNLAEEEGQKYCYMAAVLNTIAQSLGIGSTSLTAVSQLYAAGVSLHIWLPSELYSGLHLLTESSVGFPPSVLHSAVQASLDAVLQAAAAGRIENNASMALVKLEDVMPAVTLCLPDIATGRGSFLHAPDQASLPCGDRRYVQCTMYSALHTKLATTLRPFHLSSTPAVLPKSPAKVESNAKLQRMVSTDTLV